VRTEVDTLRSCSSVGPQVHPILGISVFWLAMLRWYVEEQPLSPFRASLPTQEDCANSSTEIILLAADPSRRALLNLSIAADLEKDRPHVKLAMVTGSPHDMHKERPDVVVAACVSGQVQGLTGVEAIRG